MIDHISCVAWEELIKKLVINWEFFWSTYLRLTHDDEVNLDSYWLGIVFIESMDLVESFIYFIDQSKAYKYIDYSI